MVEVIEAGLFGRAEECPSSAVLAAQAVDHRGQPPGADHRCVLAVLVEIRTA